MTLNEYIKLHEMTGLAFANLVGAQKGLVSKWRRGNVRPSRHYYQKIYEVTGGRVTPNDFFDLESVNT